MKYNDNQLEVLAITKGKHIVNAPAGCGKTEILTARVLKSLKDGEKGEGMICLTFTNRASIEMKERLASEFQDKDVSSVFVGNIHRFSSQFLHANNLIEANSTLLDDDEYKAIISGISKRTKSSHKIVNSDLYKYLNDEKRKSLGLAPIFLNKTPSINPGNKALHHAIFLQYEKVKKEFQFYDFDDLLNLTAHFLKDDNDYLFASYKWIQIDEVQDLNKSQWEIINVLSTNAKCEVYFGDYEQSIFSFLGSSHAEFLTLLKNIPYKHNLDVNYRSSEDLVKLMNIYLKKILKSDTQFEINTLGLEKSKNYQLTEVEGTVEDELNYIINLIKGEENTGSTAILVRTNKTAELCSTYLNETGIEHLKVSGADFFQRTQIKDLFALLNSLVNDFDILAWTRIFKRFSNLPNMEEARRLVYGLLQKGILPKDILLPENKTYVSDFSHAYATKRTIVFDTESTGLNTANDDIIQIAAVELVGGKVGRKFEAYFKTDQDISASSEIHKITKETLEKDGVSAEKGLCDFIEFVGEDANLLAHNLTFDYAILQSNLDRKNINVKLNLLNINYFDSLTIAKLLYPKLNSYKLEFLLSHFKLEGINSHNAIDDVNATISLVKKLASDTKQIISKQNSFLLENEKVITQIKNNFVKAYEEVQSLINKNASVKEIITFIYSNVKTKETLNATKLKAFYRLIEKQEAEYQDHSSRDKLNLVIQAISNIKEVDLVTPDTNIVISTPHKAKGLGFNTVIVTECNTGTYPGFFSKTEAEITEDKRVLYVALSRAKQKLILTHHTKVQTAYGNEYTRDLSPFIEPIADLFERNFIK